jgi:hypothetical protein
MPLLGFLSWFILSRYSDSSRLMASFFHQGGKRKPKKPGQILRNLPQSC